MRSGRVWLEGAFPASGDSRARLLLRSRCFAACPTCHPGDTRRLQGAGGASASPRTSPVRSSAGLAPGGCLRVCCFSAGDDKARGGQGGWDVQLGSPPVPRKKKQVLGAASLCTALGLWAIYLMRLDLCFFSQRRQGVVSLRCPDPSEVPRTASGTESGPLGAAIRAVSSLPDFYLVGSAALQERRGGHGSRGGFSQHWPVVGSSARLGVLCTTV